MLLLAPTRSFRMERGTDRWIRAADILGSGLNLAISLHSKSHLGSELWVKRILCCRVSGSPSEMG